MNLLKKLGLINHAEDDTSTSDSETKPAETLISNDVAVKKPSLSFAAQKEIPTDPNKVVGKIDNDIMDKLSLTIEKNNLKGNDFLEFMQSLNGLSGIAVDEKTKFNMVFKTLASSSEAITKEYLVKSIAHYLDVLKNEKNTFAEELALATESSVESRERHLEKLSNDVVNKSEQIKTLQGEIQNISQEISEVGFEITESKLKIAQKKADFEITIEQLENQIKEYQSKIEQYI